MSALELFHNSLCFKPTHLSRFELPILEANLFCQAMNILIDFFSIKFKNNSPNSLIREDNMLDAKLIHLILHDILESKSYTIEGIALYTRIPEDIIYDIALGKNLNPTFQTARKIIDLHRSVRPTLYQNIFSKAVSQHLNALPPPFPAEYAKSQE